MHHILLILFIPLLFLGTFFSCKTTKTNPFWAEGAAVFDIQQLFSDERFPNVVVAKDGSVITSWGRKNFRVRRSEDGGKSWRIALSSEAIAALQVDAAREALAEAEAALEAAPDEEREDAEYALEDADYALELAETAVEEGIPHPALDVWFESPERGYILGAYGLLLATTDGGENWALHSTQLDNPDGYHLYGIARSASGALVIAGEAGGLHRSRDDGATWERLEPPYEGSFFGILATADGNLVVFGLRGNIFRSEDDGESWTSIDAPGESTLFGGRVLSGGRIVLVGAAGTVLESRDDGRSFQTLAVGGRSARNGVVENPAGDLVLAGFGGVRVVSKGDGQ